MHNCFDRLVKLLSQEGYSPGGVVETEVEVAPDAMRIDVWFTPDAARAPGVLDPLGLFGRIGRSACTLEPFHRTPTGDQVSDCIAKHRFFCRDLRRRDAGRALPTQWILSAGKPSAGLDGWRFRPSPLGAGIHDGPPLSRTKLVVVRELPRTRDTLLVRLMGAGATLKRAVADLYALPEDAPERRLALPLLVRLRLEIPIDPAKRTRDQQEFVMKTVDVDKYLANLEERGRLKGREEGREEGFARAVLEAHENRLGAPPPALVALLAKTRDDVVLRRWLQVVTTGSAADVAAELRRSHARKSATPTPKRRATSRARTPAQRPRASATR